MVGPRGGKMFVCDSCHNAFPQKEVNVDHIEPVIPIGLSMSDLPFDIILKRMWCEEHNLQVLCKTCHDSKTAVENAMRKAHRDMNKPKKVKPIRKKKESK